MLRVAEADVDEAACVSRRGGDQRGDRGNGDQEAHERKCTNLARYRRCSVSTSPLPSSTYDADDPEGFRSGMYRLRPPARRRGDADRNVYTSRPARCSAPTTTSTPRRSGCSCSRAPALRTPAGAQRLDPGGRRRLPARARRRPQRPQRERRTIRVLMFSTGSSRPSRSTPTDKIAVWPGNPPDHVIPTARRRSATSTARRKSRTRLRCELRRTLAPAGDSAGPPGGPPYAARAQAREPAGQDGRRRREASPSWPTAGTTSSQHCRAPRRSCCTRGWRSGGGTWPATPAWRSSSPGATDASSPRCRS